MTRGSGAPGAGTAQKRVPFPASMGGPRYEQTPASASRLVALSHDLVGALDLEGRLVWANPAWEVVLGRDPAQLRFSWTGPTIVGADERDLRRRAHVRLDYNGQSDEVDDWIANMRSNGMLVGTVEQVADQIAALEQVGCSRWYFQFVPIDDHGMLELIANQLAPRLA